MANRSIIEKMGIKPGTAAIVRHAPERFLEELNAHGVTLKSRVSGEVDYIHCFLTKERELLLQFPKLKKHLGPGGKLWISWPKSGKENTELSLTRIIKIGYDFGMVESKVVSIDENWSAIKFTFPKKGKTYHNSYGTLASDTPKT